MKREAKDLARKMYITETSKQTDIAKAVDVDEKTLRRWIKDGNWDDERALHKTSRVQMLDLNMKLLNGLLRSIDERGTTPTKEESDAMSQYRKIIESLDKSNKAQVCEVFGEFLMYLQRNYPNKMMEWGKISRAYISTFKN